MVLNQSQTQNIFKKVHELEKRTAAEVVPVVVVKTVNTDHAHYITFFISALVLSWVCRFLDISIWIETAILFLSFPFTWVLSKWDFLERILTSREAIDKAVMERAEIEFYENGLQNTQGRTGVLIFVSLFEHRAVILADRAILDKLPTATWDEAVSKLIENIKTSNLEKGFLDAIDLMAPHLEKSFPAHADNKNELPNRIIVKEY